MRSEPELATATPAKRYHDLDALRAIAMLLGVVLHGLLSFIELPLSLWPAQDRYRNTEAYGLALSAIHGFRMPLFFLISGFFTAMLWRRRGMAALLKHRARRILLPMVLGLLAIWPLMIAVTIWGIAMEKQVAALRIVDAGLDSAGRARALTLWEAAKLGDMKAVVEHLDQGGDIDGSDPGVGMAALAWATVGGQTEIVRLLLERGADPDSADWQGSTALHAAAFLGRSEIFDQLLEQGASPIVENHRGETPLDSLAHDWSTVQWVSGALGIAVDHDEVMAGRAEVEPKLRSVVEQHGDSETDSFVWDDLVTWWTLGAMSPLFLHLWFLYYLCLLVVVFAAVATVIRWTGLRVPERLVSTPLRWLWLFPITLLAQWFMVQGFGADTAGGILPWPPALLYYATFFGFGALCCGRPKFEQHGGQHWWLWLLLAVPALLLGLHAVEMRSAEDRTWHAIASASAVAYAWLMVFASIGFFRRCFHGESRAMRYLSDSSYWLYVAHLPLIIAAQIVVSPWALPSIAKLGLIFVVNTGGLLIVYQVAIRYTWVGTLLNGRRERPVAAERK